MGSGIPTVLFDALRRAEERFPDVSWGMTQQGEEWRILASCRGRDAERRLHECVTNNSRCADVLDHEVEELEKAVTVAAK